MSAFRTLQFRVSRKLGRTITRSAALLTLERMPPFVSTSAIVERDGRVLAVVDAALGQPVLPGGHLKWREDPAEAVIREVCEETGYRIETDDLLAVVSGKDWAGELGIVRILYTAHVVGGELRSSHEGRALWVEPEVLANSDGRDAPVMGIWRHQRRV